MSRPLARQLRGMLSTASALGQQGCLGTPTHHPPRAWLGPVALELSCRGLRVPALLG